MTARSVLLSVLLGTDPPRLPVGLLVSTTELFGIGDGTTRTALSRMATKGEVRAIGGWYEITSERLLRRRARQESSRTGTTHPWSSTDPWRQALVVATGPRPAAARAELRRDLVLARMAELRDGVWLRPANLDVPDELRIHEDLLWGSATMDSEPVELTGRLFDLDAWAIRGRDLIAAMSELGPELEAGTRDALAPGFVVAAAVLRHFQADPLLPAALLPRSWPGGELRERYEGFDGAYRGVLREWFDEHRDRDAAPD